MSVTERAGRCPACGYSTDVVSGMTVDGAPAVGDASLCLNCAHVSIFTAYGLRSANAAEAEEIIADPLVAESIRHIRARGFIPGYRR